MKSFALIITIAVGFIFSSHANAKEIELASNADFESVSTTDYELKGAAHWGRLGGAEDITSNGIIFAGDAPKGGSVSQIIKGIDQAKGRWITFRFRGLAQDGFSVTGDALKMKIEFFAKDGADYMDCATRPLFGEIEKDRRDLAVNGDNGVHGAAVWRSYELEELIPFKEVDAVRISVSYENGAATTAEQAAFFVDDFSLIQREISLTGRVDPAIAHPPTPIPTIDESKLTALGGRWFYAAAPGETVSSKTPLTVTEENADRLFYRSDRLINPFLKNMTAWLRPGYLDEKGKVVTKDEFVPDNVVLTFKGDGFVAVRTKNIPNHPTAKFPGWNPNSIQEMTYTYRIPLEPVLNPDAVSIEKDHKYALPMGPVGIAVNGVVFFNPYDANMKDASNLMDYCCGHPNPDNQYHYHKYPICVNTAFADKGDAPSQVIGFAFDGLPVYGPYQEAGIMAKDSKTNPLNEFNACTDPVRGWHYHVTPGKFPYLIGGYLAKAEKADLGVHPHPRGFLRSLGLPPPPPPPPPPED